MTKLVPVLFGHAPKVIAKLSPMADIHMTLDLLPDVTAIQVLSVKNECKELLFVLERGSKGGSPQICCVNFTSEEEPELFAFSLVEEREAVASIRGEVKRYLYEPNASILKAGAFKAVATRFGLNKLHVSSHLYTSDEVVPSFPGRSFVVDEVIPFTNKQCRPCRGRFPKRISQSVISPSRWMSYVSELILWMEELSIFSLLLWKMGIRYLSKLIRYRILHGRCSVTA